MTPRTPFRSGHNDEHRTGEAANKLFLEAVMKETQFDYWVASVQMTMSCAEQLRTLSSSVSGSHRARLTGDPSRVCVVVHRGFVCNRVSRVMQAAPPHFQK